MSKRNSYKETSKESQALKELRKKKGYSLRKVSELMEISKTRVHQMEVGLDDVNEVYISKFLEALGLTMKDWKKELYEEDNEYELREKCHELLDTISSSKLELVYGLLSNF